MSVSSLFPSLFRYKANADERLLAAIGPLDALGREADFRFAVRILNHVHVVDRIFRAHLSGEAHAYSVTNTTETPTLAALRGAMGETDRWYIEYTSSVGPADLGQILAFRFTDGLQGRMSREEILAHVVTHGGYHRGAVGRVLDQHSLDRPPDGFTNFLHRAEPGRRAVAPG